MSKQRQQSSTSYPINFLMVLSVDHISPATGKTVTVTLSKNGAAFGAASGAVTEISSGWYSLAGHATDRATLGELLIHATATGCDPVDAAYEIITVDPFAANFGIASVTLAADQAVNVSKWNGTTVATPATAGIPDVNAKNINNVSTSSVTTINANQGTTQPVNFTGTGASALAKSDMVDVAGAVVSTGSAQIGVNAVNWAGGTIPAPAVTGVPKIDLTYILGTLLTETAGLIAAGFKKFFNTASPTSTMNQIALVDTVTTTTTATNLTNAPTSGDFTSTMKTSLNAATPASVTGAVGSVTGNVGGNVVGSVGSVLGNVAGNVTGSVGSVLGNVAGSVANLLDISAAALARFFTRDSGSTYGASVAGSVVKEIAQNATTSPTTIADAVLDALAADHDDPGTIGAKINDIGIVTDPWATDLEAGGYTAGEAGAVLLGVEAQTALFGTTSLTLNAPQFNSLNYPLVAGRTYKQQYGNALQFVLANTSIDLTDPDITFALNLRVNGVNATFPGTAVTSQTGFFEVDGADTEDWVTTANTEGTRFYGEIVVTADVSPDPDEVIDITPGWIKVVPGVNNS